MKLWGDCMNFAINFLSSFKKISKVTLIITVILLLAITRTNEAETFGLVVGSGLFITTIMISFLEGVRGAIIGVFLNLNGAFVSAFLYNSNLQDVHIIVAVFQVSIAISCAIIGVMSHRQNQAKLKLEKMAYIDFTTEAYTHGYFLEKYSQFLKKPNRYNNVSCIILDIDNFRLINENKGYSFGDLVLKSVVNKVKSILPSDEYLFRLGGDEFLIFLINYTLGDVINLSNDIKENFNSFGIETALGNIYPVKISMGIASYPERTIHAEKLLENAYTALNYSKNTGKDNVKVFRNVFDDIHDVIENEYDLELAVKTILLTLNAKDNYTHGHSIRVSDYVFRIGIIMGLSISEARKLKIAALIHDLGKINVASEILNKEGSLNDDEFSTIKKHVNFGSELVERIPYMENFKEVILHHHERYDGSGYPSGLKGDEIPLYSRIISLADSYDAMLSTRPYRKAMDKEMVIEEIENCSGRQFDPEISKIFIKAIDDGVLDINV